MRSESHLRSGAVCYLGMIVILLVTVPRLIIGGLTDWGNSLYLRAVMGSEDPQRQYPHWAIDPVPDSGRQAYQLFRMLSQMDASDASVQWGHGRAALLVGAAAEAASVLSLDSQRSAQNPLRYLDTITAYSWSGLDDQALTFYRQVPPINTHQVITNAVVIAYLRKAQTSLSADATRQVQELLQEALSVDPGNVYANYYLWRNAGLVGETERAAVYRERLTHFPTVAAVVDDEQLLSSTCEVVPHLLANGIWSIEQTRNILSYWIWRRPDSSSILHLLEVLHRDMPSEASWTFLLGEVHQRLGQIESAQSFYRQAMALDASSKYSPAQQRLSEMQSEAQNNLSQSSDQETTVAAGLLGMTQTQVHLGPILIQDQTPLQLSDRWACKAFGGTSNWPFITGVDRIEAKGSMRIANLWWPEIDQSSSYIPYSECNSPIVAVSASWLMVSFWFRADGGHDSAGASAMMANAESRDWRPYFVQVGLPDTGGKWIHLVAVGRVPTTPASLFLSIRNAYVANLWFRDVSIRIVEPLIAPASCFEKPCIKLLGQE